jgi:hypothetical protein
MTGDAGFTRQADAFPAASSGGFVALVDDHLDRTDQAQLATPVALAASGQAVLEKDAPHIVVDGAGRG